MDKRIVGARETVTLGPKGELVRVAQYEFTLDDHGPFLFEIPKEQDSPEALKEAIKEKEKILAQTLK